METKTCQRCKGHGALQADLMNLGKREYIPSIFGCPDCMGKGERVDDPNRVYVAVSYKNERPYSLKY